MGRKSKGLLSWAVFFVFILIAGCASTKIQPIQNVVAPPPLFPPQTAMKSGDYAGFFKENSEALKACQDPDKCTVALFNLSFLHCYPKSPYYDPRMGLKYIADLIAAAPESQWADQAKVWKALIERNMKKKSKKRSAREDLKTKEAEPESPELPDYSVSPVESSQDGEWEADRQRMEEQIKSKDEIIKKLNSQLERSRQIDIKMEEKERGLLK